MTGTAEADALATTETPILTEVENGVATLTLNRPGAANSIDAALARALRDAVADLDRRPDVRALMIEGAGRMFCAGGDLASFAREGDGAAAYVQALVADLHAALVQLAAFHAPVIAAVHGAVAGAGLGLMLAADLAIADAGSRFVMAYTRSGLTPDGGTSWALPRVVGLRKAVELTLMNPTLTARQALDLGLLAEVVASGELATRARAVARELADGPTAAFVAARRLLHEAGDRSYADHLGAEAIQIVESFTTAEGLEGVRAFSERRIPIF